MPHVFAAPRTRATLSDVRWFEVAVVPVVVVAVLSGCSSGGDGVRSTEPAGPSTPVTARPEVLGTIPHDPGAFTQGLEVSGDVLYEGTGLEGRSSIREVDPATGAVRRKLDLPSPLFGEGITVVGERIWQLTWRDGVAIERDRASLAEVRRVPYEGEGWGLCLDGDRLVMSDGTAELAFRDPATFEERGRVAVTRAGEPLEDLNELECVDGRVWANVWQTDEVVRIDPATGAVDLVADLSSLRPEGVPASDVLNGIASVPGSDEFLVTGKNWPSMFRVRLPAG